MAADWHIWMAGSRRRMWQPSHSGNPRRGACRVHISHLSRQHKETASNSESAAIPAPRSQRQRESLTLRQDDRQRGRSDGSGRGREEEPGSAGVIDVRLTLEHLRARLLITQRQMNSHVQRQRQEGSELWSSAFWLPLYLLLFDLPADQPLSHGMRLHGNYAAPSMANRNIIYLARENSSANVLPFS